MALFKPRTWGLVKVWRDIANYREFVRVIKVEKKDPNSLWAKWNLNHNYFYTIFFTMDVKEEEMQLPQKIMRLRMIESLAPLHRYLDEELGFAECLTPEFNQFIDEETGEPTLTYLITYRFSFNKLSFWWLIRWSFIIPALIILFSRLNLIQWIQSLI
jgi:hypothetical protein